MNPIRRSMLFAFPGSALRFAMPGSLLFAPPTYAIEPATITLIAAVVTTAIEMSKRGSDVTLATVSALREEVRALHARLDVVEKALVDLLNELATLPNEVKNIVAQELDRREGSKVEGIKQEFLEAREIVVAELGPDWSKRAGSERDRYNARLTGLLERLRHIRSAQFFREDSTNAVTLCVAAWTELDLLHELGHSPEAKKVTIRAYKERLEKTRDVRQNTSLAGLIKAGLNRREASEKVLRDQKLEIPRLGQGLVETRLWCSTRVRVVGSLDAAPSVAESAGEPFHSADSPFKMVAMRAHEPKIEPVESREVLFGLEWQQPSFPGADETRPLSSSVRRPALDKPSLVTCPARSNEPDDVREKKVGVAPVKVKNAEIATATFNSRVATIAALYYTRHAVEETLAGFSKIKLT